MNSRDIYMLRCLQLARLAAGKVAPNPMVGAILVHKERIIGEGIHEGYGGHHAEKNCFDSVAPQDREFIRDSILYVNLEPCSHFGKTPPCADLCIQQSVKEVRIGIRDPFPEVSGRGVARLAAAGIQVTEGVLQEECRHLNRRFLIFQTEHRPYIVLKWAQTADGFSGRTGTGRLYISNEQTNRLVHRWRSNETAILIGTNTAVQDDPELTVRLWPGSNPIRLVIDKNLRIPGSARLYGGESPTIVFNRIRHTLPGGKFIFREFADRGTWYYQTGDDAGLVHQILNALYLMNIQSVLVEGGTRLLQSFIDAGLWDEARVITARSLTAGSGIRAPVPEHHHCVQSFESSTDLVSFYYPADVIKSGLPAISIDGI